MVIDDFQLLIITVYYYLMSGTWKLTSNGMFAEMRIYFVLNSVLLHFFFIEKNYFIR